MAPCLLDQRCLSEHLFSAKDATTIVSGRSSDSRSSYSLHLPNETSVDSSRFRHAHSGGTVADSHSLPFYSLKDNQILTSRKPEILFWIIVLKYCFEDLCWKLVLEYCFLGLGLGLGPGLGPGLGLGLRPGPGISAAH